MTELGISDPNENGHPAEPQSSVEHPVFSSRREMRAAGGYDSRGRGTGRRKRAARTTSTVAPRERPKATVREQVARGGVMLVIGGLFAALAIPAYADQASEDASDVKPLAAQTLDFEAASLESDSDAGELRDSYGATSASQLRKLYADAIRQSNLAAYLASGAKEMGDDYPWFAELTRYQGGGLSPLNYYYRECVDFVAWRLNRDAGSTSAPFLLTWSYLTPGGGDARAWKYNWINHGWPTGTEPKVGAVAWFPGANHVAYVSGILEDGSVLIEEYNGQLKHAYAQRVIQASEAYYLYAPPLP